MPGLPFQGRIERVTLLPTHLPLSTVLGCAVGGRQSSEGWSLVQGEGQVNAWMRDSAMCTAWSAWVSRSVYGGGNCRDLDNI